MGIRPAHPKILIVEGHDDKFSVVGLMKHHINWPAGNEAYPVFIEVASSAGEILQQGYLTAQIKSNYVETVGVILDADEHSAGRYQRIRDLLKHLYPDLPERMPKDGLITSNEQQKRLGIWLMPDNASEGCMEIFLRHLVPSTDEAIWDHAVDSVRRGRDIGAPCRNPHVPKAELFTWLAWQDPPGFSPGMALTKKILDPASPHANTFVQWFRLLYAV